ncbi:thiamine-phosphate kinase [Oceanobacter mangrovi]|uniref:thiamine-phosphate kinase n=1 Tax=Oceanobacter mangrovi TaxID=2862510 RepID=UPI001C8EBDB7|nr:thiamine-phosphate kinase [Oceanobacter mangrovi]
MNSEFELIQSCFSEGYPVSPDTLLAIGDDASIVIPPNGQRLVQSLDSQVADVHFPASAPANLIAQRALRCAVSDLAAMGARPQGFLLGLTLPDNQTAWLNDFASGLRAAAHECGISLIGGDTTRGQQLVISVMVQGWIDSAHTGLPRSAAQPTDDIWVSGVLGESALALPRILKQPDWQDGLARAYYFPQPRLALGQALHGIAHAAMDISDGLLQDAGHIAQASRLQLVLNGEQIPSAVALGHPDWPTCLNGGDDYELLFTAAVSQRLAIEQLSQQLHLPLSRIGHCQPCDDGKAGVELLADGLPVTLARGGFQHF